MTHPGWKNSIGAGLLFALGLFFVNGALEMDLGTARHMGPGFFPLVLGTLVTVLSLLVIVISFFKYAELEQPDLRSFVAVASGVAAFGFITSNFGIIPAAFISVLVSSFADSRLSIKQKLILAIGVSIATWLIFIVALQLPFTSWRMP